MRLLKNSKVILQCKRLLFLLLFFVSFYCFYTLYTYELPQDKIDRECIGIVTNIQRNPDRITLEVKSDQKYLLHYYTSKNIEIKLGDKIKARGKYQIPENNRNFYTFNYRTYLLSKNIEYLFYVDDIKIIEKNNHIFYKIKNKIIDQIETLDSKKYVYAFLLGDKNEMEEDVKDSFSKNGISHLFAVSGMHVTLFSLLILKVLKTKYKEIICILFLIFYLFLTGYTPSVIRSVFLFILLTINKKLQLHIPTLYWFLFIFAFMLLYNPFYLYHIGFNFSFFISFILIIFSNKINDCIYPISKLFMTSFLAFLGSIPILLMNYYEINVISIIWNLFFVPFVSYIIFPLTLMTFVFPFLDSALLWTVEFMEKISLFLSDHTVMFVFGRWSLYVTIMYIVVLWFGLKKNQYYVIFVFLIVLYFFPNVNYNPEIVMNDVGQGDSILIRFPYDKGNVLIDVGGKISWKNQPSYVSKNIITYLKSQKIRKIDYLILTHGY